MLIHLSLLQIKKVTAQELDIKVRTKLNNAYKLYDRMTSDVQKGYIKFHSHSEHKESFIMIYFILKGNLWINIANL